MPNTVNCIHFATLQSVLCAGEILKNQLETWCWLWKLTVWLDFTTGGGLATQSKGKDKQAKVKIQGVEPEVIEHQFNPTHLSLNAVCVGDMHSLQVLEVNQMPCEWARREQSRTVSLFSGLTSIMPLSRDWQSGGIKWGMWNTPLFTFSRSWRKLSWSKGRAP